MRQRCSFVTMVMTLVFVFFCGSQLLAKDLSGQKNPQNIWNGPKAKYTFFFIGDGMGLQQVSSAEAFLAAQQKETKPGVVLLSFSQFADQGLSTTYSANSFITDSAPAGTALATGYKTDNGVIGVDPSKKYSFATIAELAKEAGQRVGIISTVTLNHATPASFYAHIPSRNSYYEIGEQLIASGFDYFAGGGIHKSTAKDKAGNPREDLYQVAEKKGFTVVRDRDSIMGLTASKLPVIAVNGVLDGSNAMPYTLDQGDKDVTLAEFVQKGIELLDNDKGFFMSVEGGKIDWACHANDAAASIHDTLALNDAVEVAIKFAADHPDETLIVVTGDHETGGMSLGFSGTEYASFFDKIGHQKVSYISFDKEIAALREAKGTAATLDDIKGYVTENFGLTFMSTDDYNALAAQAKESKTKNIYNKLGMALSPAEQQQISDALALSMAGEKNDAPDMQEFLLYGGYEPLSIQITHILNNKAGIGWTSYAHTGIPVPVFASGVGSELFRGYYDNTDVAWKIFSILGLDVPQPAPFTAHDIRRNAPQQTAQLSSSYNN
jgi:alkaline phosphatase